MEDFTIRESREKLEELNENLHALWDAYAMQRISFNWMLDQEQVILERINFHKQNIKEKIHG